MSGGFVNQDETLRAAMFQWLREQMARWQDVLPRPLLESGFSFQGETVTLVGPRGIWIPRQLHGVPISIATTYNGPYDDQLSDDGLLIYHIQGHTTADLNNRDNVALRTAMQRRLPLVYFKSVSRGWYLPVFPVFVALEDPVQLSFGIAVDPAYGLGASSASFGSCDDSVDSPLSIKRYVHAMVKSRLHQGRFRIDVLTAYGDRCCLCRLAHRELLDAAHIVPDSEPGGDPIVPNGLSLCKIHHAAYDQNFLGISPDYEVHVNRELLLEIDGPMLKHGIQELHGSRLVPPGARAKRPDRERLDWRFERFRRAG